MRTPFAGLLAVAILGCGSSPPEGPGRWVRVDAKQCLQNVEHLTQPARSSLPADVLDLVRRIYTLKDQIAILPRGSILREEQFKNLVVARRDLMGHVAWTAHLARRSWDLDKAIERIHDAARKAATASGGAALLMVNRPYIDPDSGGIGFQAEPFVLTDRTSIEDVTPEVIRRLRNE